MASLDSILNTAIPIGIIVIFIGLIYWKLKEPIDGILRVFGKGLGRLWEMLSDTGSSTKEVTYK